MPCRSRGYILSQQRRQCSTKVFSSSAEKKVFGSVSGERRVSPADEGWGRHIVLETSGPESQSIVHGSRNLAESLGLAHFLVKWADSGALKARLQGTANLAWKKKIYK
jgi:hypothetical protein